MSKPAAPTRLEIKDDLLKRHNFAQYLPSTVIHLLVIETDVAHLHDVSSTHTCKTISNTICKPDVKLSVILYVNPMVF